MNYRHIYHAGNFCDVFKHVVLTALTTSLLRKEAGFCFLDTHAGIGCYDLSAREAQRNPEFQHGIAKVRAALHPPPLVQQYLECVAAVNEPKAKTLQYYPGSPAIVRQYLRSQDRMVLCELHPADCETLKQTFEGDRQTFVHCQDGYQGLKAFLPPKERRGLVLIDPPYEKPNEFMDVPQYLAQAVKRWDTGIYALWYPIKHIENLPPFYAALSAEITKPMLSIELSIFPENIEQSLNGNGLIIVNPPWQFEEQIQAVLPWLWQILSPEKQGRHSVKAW